MNLLNFFETGKKEHAGSRRLLTGRLDSIKKAAGRSLQPLNASSCSTLGAVELRFGAFRAGRDTARLFQVDFGLAVQAGKFTAMGDLTGFIDQ